MKIQKISSTQVKFLFTGKDLVDRGINSFDFCIGSEKIKNLIQEVTEQAAATCGFDADEQGVTPIMIEAAPYEKDGILIIVSRVNGNINDYDKFTIEPEAMADRHYIKCDVKYNIGDGFTSEYDSDDIAIYSFETLNDVENACECMQSYYNGNSSLYKNENRYYLVLYSDNFCGVSQEEFDLLISEFGQKHISSTISKGYLIEYGEPIIEKNALTIMASI